MGIVGFGRIVIGFALLAVPMAQTEGLAKLAAGEYPCAPAFNETTSAPADIHARAVALARSGHLSEAMRLQGFVDLRRPPSEVVIRRQDLGAFVQRSTAVVVGKLTDRHCYLTADDRNVISAYSLSVDTTLKGDLQVGSTVVISLAVGRIVFPDGKWAQVRVRDLTPLIGTERVLMVLRASTMKLGEALNKRAGPLGVFEVSSDGAGSFVVDPLDNHLTSLLDWARVPAPGRAEPLAAFYNSKPLDDLLKDIRAVAK